MFSRNACPAGETFAPGHRSDMTDASGTTKYCYSPLGQLVRKVQKTGNYTYDANGNILNDGVRTYRYNAANRTDQIVHSGITSTMLYNGEGQRVLKTVTQTGQATEYEYYFYDEQGRVIGEYSGSTGALDNEMVYHADLPILAIRPSGVWMIHSDQLGTPRALVGTSGTIAWSWDSAAFGNTLQNSDPDGNLSHVYFDHRFPGQLYDSETQIHYNYFRDYDPSTGRYVQSDPIGLEGGINTYGYANQNPIRFVDPLGLYGTTSCAYYTERCKKDGGLYYCNIAPTVCSRTPDSRWTRCVRKCLQEADSLYCEPKQKNMCGGSDLPCVVNIHQMCWQECIKEGTPPSTQSGF